jgi:hypothetical protein
MTNTSNNTHGPQRPTRRAAIQAKAKITKLFASQNQLQVGVAVRPKKAKKTKTKKKEDNKKKATRSCNCRYAFSILNTKSKL